MASVHPIVQFLKEGNLKTFLTAKPLNWTAFYEPQKDLLCGQHALNNLFHNIDPDEIDFRVLFFTDAKSKYILYWNNGFLNVNLHALCPKIIAEEEAILPEQRLYNCGVIGDYSIDFITILLRQMNVLLEIDDIYGINMDLQKIATCQGIIVNQNASHWIAVVKKKTYEDESGNENHEWIWIDSIESVGKIFIKSDELLKEYFSKKKCGAKLYVQEFNEKRGEAIKKEIVENYNMLTGL